jgi:CDP-ribitol ribitolphosphotransferase
VSRVDTFRTALVRAGFLIGRLAPLRSRVLLATAHADRIGGNLAWIRDGLAHEPGPVRTVELAGRVDRSRRALPRLAVAALRAGFHLATARLTVVDDYFFPMYVIRPRRGTTFVQVWHACGAMKRFGYSLGDRSFGAGARRRGEVAIHSTYDCCLVSAERFAPFYAEAFGLPVERFTARLGIPRTDLFFDEARRARAATAVRARYGIPDGRRVVLYAPTFRGDSVGAAKAPDQLDLRVLRGALGEDHVILAREHPFVGRAAADPALAGFVIDVSGHEDVNELMLVSDVLVTDYSSVMFEFALLGRPMAFFAPDHAAYEAERGFYVDYPRYVPGPVFESSESLAAHLRTGPFDLERVRRFAAESFDVADGRATDRFIAEIVRPALGMPSTEPIG